jgi:hypothetical protein
MQIFGHTAAMDQQCGVTRQPAFVLWKRRHDRNPGRGDQGLAEKPHIVAMLLTQQPHLFGEATADFGVAAISE